MSQPNSITVWLRPVGAIQPYVITNCANWLVKCGNFKNYSCARQHLDNLERTFPKQFVHLISLYHEANDYKRVWEPTNRNVNQLYSATDAYGSCSQKWTKSERLV